MSTLLAYRNLGLFLLVLSLACQLAVGQQGSLAGVYHKNDVKAIPSFVIIGTAKGGTTDLHAQLVNDAVNSDPARPNPPVIRSRTKETNFLTSRYNDSSELAPGMPLYFKYLDVLLHPCANATAATLDACIEENGRKQYTLDATPTYLFAARALNGLSAVSPNSKVIVMLRDPVDRAEILFRHIILHEGGWKTYALDQMTEAFFGYLVMKPDVNALFTQLSECSDVNCITTHWRSLLRSGILESEELKLFIGGLYRYALATWRVRYAKPGRFMVIDSHAYFRNRTAVMEQVIYFLYGRAMTAIEASTSSGGSFWRKTGNVLSKAGQGWRLSTANREKLQAFYNTHVVSGFDGLVKELKNDGAWVVGFDDEPWVKPKVTVADVTVPAATASSASADNF